MGGNSAAGVKANNTAMCLIFQEFDKSGNGYLDWDEFKELLSVHHENPDHSALDLIVDKYFPKDKPSMFNLSAFSTLFQICNRCSEMRGKKNTSSRDKLLIVRTSPGTFEGNRVKACEHFQWTWCPGFSVTGNLKCKGSNRHDGCAKYLANCTLWKHRLPPKRALDSSNTTPRSKSKEFNDDDDDNDDYDVYRD